MMEQNKPVSKDKPLDHYRWGNACDGWNFVSTDALSVKQERMPPHTSEQMHRHKHAQQFFFILSGEAVFEIEGKTISVKNQEGLTVYPGQVHRISNETESDLEFLLCSQPATGKDRENVSEQEPG
jgi:mannose-6-phosphate isomerase-like protein (cupin superfamily)